MNGWLIAGIVIGVIAAIIAIIVLLVHILHLMVNFKELDRNNMGVPYDKYIESGYTPFVISIFLGIATTIYNVFGRWGSGTYWEKTREHNMIFLIVFIGILLISVLQAIMVYNDKYAIKRKIWLSIYYCTLGFIGGVLTSVIFIICKFVSMFKDLIPGNAEPKTYTLSDGTEVREVRDLITGINHDEFEATDGSGRRYRREGDVVIRK